MCEACGGSGIEEIYGGHGTVLELPCSNCQKETTMSDVILNSRWSTQEGSAAIFCDDVQIAACLSDEIAEAIVNAQNIILMSKAIRDNIVIDKDPDGGILLDLNTDFVALAKRFED
jgi:ABC-type transport system involved in cytochrome bd biosynthesis fused ATPase/permease subunit